MTNTTTLTQGTKEVVFAVAETSKLVTMYNSEGEIVKIDREDAAQRIQNLVNAGWKVDVKDSA